MKTKVITSLLVSYSINVDRVSGFGECTVNLVKPLAEFKPTTDDIEDIRKAIQTKQTSTNASIVILNIIPLYSNV